MDTNDSKPGPAVPGEATPPGQLNVNRYGGRRDIHRVWDALDALFDDPGDHPPYSEALWLDFGAAIRSVEDRQDRAAIYHSLDRGLRKYTGSPTRYPEVHGVPVEGQGKSDHPFGPFPTRDLMYTLVTASERLATAAMRTRIEGGDVGAALMEAQEWLMEAHRVVFPKRNVEVAPY
jgi:hypothetical protein